MIWNAQAVLKTTSSLRGLLGNVVTLSRDAKGHLLGAPEPKNARSRKREALERFVDKNAKILAELAK